MMKILTYKKKDWITNPLIHSFPVKIRENWHNI